MARAISVRDLIDQVTSRCPEGGISSIIGAISSIIVLKHG